MTGERSSLPSARSCSLLEGAASSTAGSTAAAVRALCWLDVAKVCADMAASTVGDRVAQDGCYGLPNRNTRAVYLTLVYGPR